MPLKANGKKNILSYNSHISRVNPQMNGIIIACPSKAKSLSGFSHQTPVTVERIY